MEPDGDLELDPVQESLQKFIAYIEAVHAPHRDLFSPSYFIVPSLLREVSPSSFTPEMVSIGPLHKEDIHLQPYQGWKSSYLKNLLSRMPSPPEEVLKSCMRKVYAVLDQIKACYDWTLTCDDSAICQTMVRDACFILELMFKIGEYKEMPHLPRWPMVKTILHDLVLLENQIPLFVLDEIFQSTVLKINPEASLVEFLLPVLSSNNIFKADINIDNISIVSVPHILGLLHHCYKPHTNKEVTSDFEISTALSAVHPYQAWATLKPSKDPTSLIEMDLKSCRSFCHYGPWNNKQLTLTMSVLQVYGFTELVLRNLIAYEQCLRQPCRHITSYAYAMSVLVKTEEHVTKLVDSRVLANYLSSDGAVVSIFNNILKHEEEWKTPNKYPNGCEIWMRSTCFSRLWNMLPWSSCLPPSYRYDHPYHH